MAAKAKVLLAEDDASLGFIMKDALEEDGYEVVHCPDGQTAIDRFNKNEFDICLLDIMMPNKDGYAVAKKIRQQTDVMPVLFLSTKNQEEDRLKGYDTGADDYISKPISQQVFLSKVNSLFRRLKKKENKIIEHNGLVIDPEKYIVSYEGKEHVLAKKEFELLHLLASKAGRVFLRNEILSQVWGNDVIVGDRTIDVHIRKIRQKLGLDCITTVKGVGYKFEM